jgi:hypothetical protein
MAWAMIEMLRIYSKGFFENVTIEALTPWSPLAFWDYLSDFLPLLSHSPPWFWWSRFSAIVWSTTSPQIKHRQLKKGPFEPKNSSWIIIPLHRLHFTLTSQTLSRWDPGDWNKVNAVFYPVRK